MFNQKMGISGAMNSFKVLLEIASIGCVFWGIPSFSNADSDPTHKQAYTIKPELPDKSIALRAFCVCKRGNLWLACESRNNDGTQLGGLVMEYDPSGKLLNSFPLAFLPHAITFSPDNKLFVAGSGKVARVALNGEVDIEIDSPNIGNREELMERARKFVEHEYAELQSTAKKQTEVIEAQIAELQNVPDAESESARSKRERRLKVLRLQLRTLTQRSSTSLAIPTQEQVLADLLSCTAIAATANEVYVSFPEPNRSSFGVWRLSQELVVESKVAANVQGCCGCFDLHTDGTNIAFAENTKFKVGIYDRNGKAVSSFGKHLEDDEDGFSSCCNPMNVRCETDGTIVTAESGGDIKRFNQQGHLISVVGNAIVSGGCKRVPIGFSPDLERYYMLNEKESHIAVLVSNEKYSREK